MKTSGFWQTPLRAILLHLLSLVSLIPCFSSANTGHFHSNTYNGKVGGNISFHCPADEKKQLRLLYFQKVGKEDPIFLNGYHSTRSLTPVPNTEMDPSYRIMHMYDLQLSDSGKYECQYMYEDSSSPEIVKMHLIVTAYFSTPVIKMDCNEGSGIPSECHVKCDSYNGLPRGTEKKMEWKVPENISSEIWKILKNEEQPSSKGLVNISSTAYFNCSGGKVMVSCSVNETTSDIIAVCSPNAPPDQPDNTAVVIAVVVCSLVIVLLLIWFICKKTTGTYKGSRQSPGENGQPEEVIVLNNIPEQQMGS